MDISMDLGMGDRLRTKDKKHRRHKRRGDDVESAETQLRLAMEDLRNASELCDAELRCGRMTFRVHKAFLAAHSPYFRALFTIDMKESGKRTFDAPTDDPEVMRSVIQFIYTNQINWNYNLVFPLLEISDRLLMNDLKTECSRFLARNIRHENIFEIKIAAETYNCLSLKNTCRRFMLDNLPQIARYNENFKRIEQTDLFEILDDNTLDISKEDILFEAVMTWINYDFDERSACIPLLLRRLRLGLLPSSFFREHIMNNPVFSEREDCKELIKEAKSLMAIIDSGGGGLLDLNNPLICPRFPQEVLFAVGGWSRGTPVAVFETYDTRADRWYKHFTLEDTAPRAYHGMCAIDNCLYIIGGFDGAQYFNSVRRFNPIDKSWREVAPMYHQRCYVACAAVRGRAYACGGYDGRTRLKAAECYTPSTNQWMRITDMSVRRSDAGATQCGGFLYVAGGFDGTHCLESIERFDPDANQWTAISTMNVSRSGVAIVGHQGNIYALGGFDGESRLLSAERYCPATNSWADIAPMATPRSNFAAAVIDDYVFAIGGFNGTLPISHVECYDVASNEWYVATEMNLNRSAVKACVLRHLPNVVDYTFHGNYEQEYGREDAIVRPAMGGVLRGYLESDV